MTEWRERPLWRRLSGKPRRVAIQMEYEPLHGSFATLADAEVAAQQAADTLDDPMDAHVGVAILDDDGVEAGGYWSRGGGSF